MLNTSWKRWKKFPLFTRKSQSQSESLLKERNNSSSSPTFEFSLTRRRVKWVKYSKSWRPSLTLPAVCIAMMSTNLASKIGRGNRLGEASVDVFLLPPPFDMFHSSKKNFGVKFTSVHGRKPNRKCPSIQLTCHLRKTCREAENVKTLLFWLLK